ncbi:protein TIFY 10A-like isoform X1 [Tripterygium wilfordii]|uniref:protein TIFY 10A-like isoform X1 n=1 Tax=Tripterygium wilfordii TaxID=458696 RepID=UPI0018F83467|nr:protein TIFY 10A-like isoform X1 [Tripterygium wilfordii]
MSTATESSEFGEQKPAGRFPEKSSFSHKCSLLSQYLKEFGSFGDLSLGMTCNIEGNGNGKPEMLRRAATVLNLFPISEKPGEVLGQNNAKMLKPMNLFPETTGFHVFKEEELPKRADSCYAAGELQTAQMTIFYGGQVFVFNDFSADKMKEIMLLASEGNAQCGTTFPSTHRNIASKPVEARSLSPPNISPNFVNDLKQDCIQTPTQPLVSAVLPLTRKASLQSFLEKRRDRITARAPYQTRNPKAALSKLPVENNSWLGLLVPSPQ